MELHRDESVEPVEENKRPTFHVRKHIEKQLKRDVQLDIIERLSGPTPWISRLFVVPKTNPTEARVRVDMRCAKKSIERKRHAMTTFSEIMHGINGTKVFSKIDMNQANNQLVPDESSRYVTT